MKAKNLIRPFKKLSTLVDKFIKQRSAYCTNINLTINAASMVFETSEANHVSLKVMICCNFNFIMLKTNTRTRTGQIKIIKSFFAS